MVFTIQSTAAIVSSGVKCVVYGKAGVGKTRLSGTAPAPIILSAEAGLLSLRQYNLPYVEITSIYQLREVYQWIAQANEARQFQTIVLDSLSEIIEQILEFERTRTKDPRKAYGEIIIQGIQLVRGFRDLPGRNVVMICKEEWSKDETSGMMYNGPSFPGQKLAPALPYYPDEVFQYCVFTNPQTRARTEALRCWPDQTNIAKDRSGALNEWEPPHLGQIFAKIAGSQQR
jgi:hypothetical protein